MDRIRSRWKACEVFYPTTSTLHQGGIISIATLRTMLNLVGGRVKEGSFVLCF